MGFQQNLLAEENLQIDPVTADHLKETAKWAKFISIAGFIFSGMIIIFAIYYYNLMTKYSFGYRRYNNTLLLSVLIYVVVAIVWIVTSVYQMRFATKLLLALETNDQNEIQQSFFNLKIYYRISGIVTIIGLLLSFLGLIGMMSNNTGL